MIKKEKIKIGWREFIDLPEWRIKGLRAKIDTGAKSCALHVEKIRELPHNQIEFYVILSKAKARKKVVAKAVKKAGVKSSIGVRTVRYYVQTKLGLGPHAQKVPISLVGREEMNYRMLIGRDALKGKFIVDAGRSYLMVPHKKRRKKIRKR